MKLLYYEPIQSDGGPIKSIDYKSYCLRKHGKRDVLSLINRKMLIHKQLERPPRTYVVYSDLHGSYEKFLHWLKNGLGYYKIAIKECLGKHYSENILSQFEKLLFIVNKTRFDQLHEFIESDESEYTHYDSFFESVPKRYIECLKDLEGFGLSKKRILSDLLSLLRGITRGDERRIIKAIPTEYLENILKLYQGEEEDSYQFLIEGIVDNIHVYQIMSSLLVKIILQNMFDKHINLGDTYDRGDGADKLVKLYRTFFNEKNNVAPLHYILGNHDILWMGASIGNPALIMTALRISMRYNNVEFLGRYGFNLDKLRAFSRNCYNLLPEGNYVKSKDLDDDAHKMTKALFVLETKLTVSLLRNLVKEMEVKGEDDLLNLKQEFHRYEKLLKLLPTDISESKSEWEKAKKENPLLLDHFFPTIDKNNPEALTSEEEEVVADLVNQFTTLPKLKDDMKWIYEKGEVYRVVDTTLYFHAAIPSTEDKEIAQTGGLSGKKHLDSLQIKLKKIGERHFSGEELSIKEKMYLWHLWCGGESVFFCKSKMATVERTIFDKDVASRNELTTHREAPNPFYKNIRDEEFLGKVLSEFHAEKICMGHTPVKSMNQAVLSAKVGAYVIDGGASPAYGDKGAVLINTPEYTYLTLHPSLNELIDAEKEDRLPEFTILPLEEKSNLKLRHMDKGHFLKEELEAIDNLLDQKMESFQKDYFY